MKKYPLTQGRRQPVGDCSLGVSTAGGALLSSVSKGTPCYPSLYNKGECVFGVTQPPAGTYPVVFQGRYMEIRTLSWKLTLSEVKT